MAQNITLMGASYSAVPAVTLPKTGGGTASFTDVTDTTAAAADVASGKYFYTASGVRTQGTNSGGGGGSDAEDGIIERTISGAYTNSRVTTIGMNAFHNCSSLTTASFPNVTTISSSAFYRCSSLTEASFPKAKSIGSQAFRNCTKLMSLYILASSVATLGPSAFLSTPMSLSTYTGSFGSIYVPASLVSSYKTATNWKSYSARITSYV